MSKSSSSSSIGITSDHQVRRVDAGSASPGSVAAVGSNSPDSHGRVSSLSRASRTTGHSPVEGNCRRSSLQSAPTSGTGSSLTQRIGGLPGVAASAGSGAIRRPRGSWTFPTSGAPSAGRAPGDSARYPFESSGISSFGRSVASDSPPQAARIVPAPRTTRTIVRIRRTRGSSQHRPGRCSLYRGPNGTSVRVSRRHEP